MRGVILAIAPDGTYGQLLAEDGQHYSYWTSEVRNGPAQVGQSVDFQLWEGQPVDIFVVKQAPVAPGSRQFVPLPDHSGAPTPGSAVLRRSYATLLTDLPPLEYWINLFTSPAGRISRKQFWLHGVLPIFLCSLILGWIPLLGFLVSLALMWAGICISFKRFHDLGYPGWWSLLNVIPMVLAVFFTAGSFVGVGLMWYVAQAFWVIALIVWLVQMALVYLRVGQPGSNRYGPDPLASR